MWPPLTATTWPVIHAAPSEARKATAWPTSRGSPRRGTGWPSANSGGIPPPAMTPSDRAFTVTPDGPTSWATWRVHPTAAAFEAP